MRTVDLPAARPGTAASRRGVARLASATVPADDLADADATAATAHRPDALDWLGQVPSAAALLVTHDGTVLSHGHAAATTQPSGPR